MEDKYGDDFIARNSLIPLGELENSPYKPTGFAFTPLRNQIATEGLKADDFYFNPGDAESPYCFYRGSILLDFAVIDRKIGEIKTLIERLEKDINESVANRDFNRFLSLVDRRLVPDLFMEVFNFIPDQDKYRLFERVWKYNQNSHDVFTEEFIKKVSKYKGVTDSRPVADAEGYVRVYRSQDEERLLPNKVSSWSTDVNIAILNALPLDPRPTIYQGKIHHDNIISFDNDRFKKEIQVEIHNVEQVEVMELINLLEFDNELRKGQIIEKYNYYANMINNDWFHNPQGIHALGHTKRVLLLSLIICFLENFNKRDQAILGFASIYHDIGRKNDGYDPDHGLASYSKLVNEQLIKLDDFHENEILKFLIQNHAIPDQSAYKKINRYNLMNVERTLKLYDAFKDADGLDRVRLKDLNPEYLRTGSAQRLILAAHQLYSQKVVYK
ncbi:MAG: HD domain-containing protein [Syntrophomonas sp.]